MDGNLVSINCWLSFNVFVYNLRCMFLFVDQVFL